MERPQCSKSYHKSNNIITVSSLHSAFLNTHQNPPQPFPLLSPSPSLIPHPPSPSVYNLLFNPFSGAVPGCCAISCGPTNGSYAERPNVSLGTVWICPCWLRPRASTREGLSWSTLLHPMRRMFISNSSLSSCLVKVRRLQGWSGRGRKGGGLTWRGQLQAGHTQTWQRGMVDQYQHP